MPGSALRDDAEFLMVVLVQNSQHRDAAAVQLKLDELIRAVSGARNALIDLEDLDDGELERLRARYSELAQRAKAQPNDFGVPKEG